MVQGACIVIEGTVVGVGKVDAVVVVTLISILANSLTILHSAFAVSVSIVITFSSMPTT